MPLFSIKRRLRAMTLDIPALRALAAAARERADSAARGPWTHTKYDISVATGVIHDASGSQIASVSPESIEPPFHRPSADFIAAARTDVPALADALVAALDELERLRDLRDAAHDMDNEILARRDDQ